MFAKIGDFFETMLSGNRFTYIREWDEFRQNAIRKRGPYEILHKDGLNLKVFVESGDVIIIKSDTKAMLIENESLDFEYKEDTRNIYVRVIEKDCKVKIRIPSDSNLSLFVHKGDINIDASVNRLSLSVGRSSLIIKGKCDLIDGSVGRGKVVGYGEFRRVDLTGGSIELKLGFTALSKKTDVSVTAGSADISMELPGNPGVNFDTNGGWIQKKSDFSTIGKQQVKISVTAGTAKIRALRC